VEEPREPLAEGGRGLQATPESPLDGLERRVPEILGRVISWVANTGLSLVSQGAVVLVFLVFLILGYRPPEDRDPNTLWAQLRRQINEYVRVKAIVSFVTGLLTFVILEALGVDLALVFGTMAFFLNFIPNVGSFVAMLLPLPIVVLAPPEQLGLAEKLLAFGGPGAVQVLMGNLVEPRWMGRSLDLHPVVVLLSLIFWGTLWGPIGMLLSVPITSVIKTLLERSELTRPVADLLDNEA
jgi:AI-2 transport protein TqsA